MFIFKAKKDLVKYLSSLNSGYTVGFVPTMGALHQGHLSLIAESKKKCDITVCSIYINPSQFSDSVDLLKYPRTISSDIIMLTMAACDVLYSPETEEYILITLIIASTSGHSIPCGKGRCVKVILQE